mmetsp:Transcript_72457/g.200935  ORF Transcript_72457/g.200935 Transcript_72457/m.200935 type:complete len:313 (-) Transcript_72457:158-1096(-)
MLPKARKLAEGQVATDVKKALATSDGPVIPAGAVDCHFHVFGAVEAYLTVPESSYTPQPAPLEQWHATVGQLGFRRAVFVQPSCYGADNRCMLDAMATSTMPCRGVAVIKPDTPRETLAAMHSVGVRGVRLNFNSSNIGRSLEELLAETATQVAPLGWHVQVFAALETLVGAADAIRASPVPIVIDHMGLATAAAGANQPGFDVLLKLLADGSCWVKLSGAYRIADDELDFSSSIAIARKLVEANPRRVVWGSDWPHVGHHKGPTLEGKPPAAVYRPLDVRRLLETLASSCGDDDTLRRVLVENPAELYGFQ